MSAGFQNVASHLTRLASEQPDRPAVICLQPAPAGTTAPTEQLTFQELNRRCDAIAHGLVGIGIRRGVRTAVMVRPSLDFFALTFAMFKVGAIPVLIDPGMGILRLGKCLEDAEPQAFIGLPIAHVFRNVLGWARRTIKITLTTGRWKLGLARHSLPELIAKCSASGPFQSDPFVAEEQAAILFTSGSTGPAKGVIYTHGIFAAQVDALRAMYRIEPGEVDLPTFPLFALFGPALGMTAVIPDMDPTRPAQVDARKLIDAIHRFQVTSMFGSPAVINRVGRYGQNHPTQLTTLRRVISAGAPVSAKAIERFTALLPNGVQVHTPYGATESLPVATIGSDEILHHTRSATDSGCGVCVGKPVPGVEAFILPIHDEPIAIWDESLPLPPGTVGEITVSSRMVTPAYYRLPTATAKAKIVDPKTGRRFHRMGDVGYIDALGRLWFCGRKSHRVVTKSGTWYTIPTEAIFNTHPAVFRSALVGVVAGEATIPVICIERDPEIASPPDRDLLAELLTLAAGFPHTRGITTLLIHPKFPVDIRHNAKIFREKLAVWATEELKRRGITPTIAAPAAPVPIAHLESQPIHSVGDNA
ncbi:fatty acid CoA ligase family protein [Tuwongella immobilis]|uniref:AMP-dependent synthetase/ligase domain-containing protein n=1 Tax=Tuwongella immobilis TaxID=692036 RepID=A0A6C2YP42_9BACT|nr:fatty acid CoA ligase family protein [Tuwongella immobilis]VIP03206.1 peptide synthase : AMP-dependent synthetase and ligase OS=Geobacter sp. (strain M18) GN=GM18_2132 PE=4 SV=1: AMP-binding [Tuwongella immobilis]VTS03706.1 peptide synthase : AMP-dependent synthetase and ligase OS=Geobacter sp. (strain M18) GN=GM18_2132 PE=4 SV=1: AMP-binding [Tuwongella immobilis]